jgi:transposase
VRSGRAAAYLALQPEAVRSADLIRFLRHLHRHVRGHIVLFWDGLHAHRSLETTAYLQANHGWLTVYRLPAYAPELNPVEAIWSWFKGGVVPNLCPDGLGPLRHELRRGRRRLQRRTDLLQGFLHKAGLFL